MTSPKSSVNKQSASYDFKKALQSMALPAVFLLLILGVYFIVYVLDDISFVESGVKFVNPVVMLVPEFQSLGVTLWCLFGGVLFALTNFYIMSKSTVNFFLSAPVDRGTLFKNRTLAAMLLGACVIGVNVLVSTIINLVNFQVFPLFIIKMALAVFAECFVYFLAGYVIMTIGIFACYTVIEGLLFGVGLVLLPMVVLIFFQFLFSSFLNGYSRMTDGMFDFMVDGIEITFAKPALTGSLSILNPLTFGQAFGETETNRNILYLAYGGNRSGVTDYVGNDLVADYQPAVLPNMNYIWPVIIWAALCVGGIFFARYLFVHRKAEKTAINGSTPFATHLFATEAGLAAAAFACMITGAHYENKRSTYVVILGIAILVLAVYLIVLALGKRQVIFKNKKAYAAPAALSLCVLVLAAVLHFGGLGYATYAPKADRVKAAMISGGTLCDMLNNEPHDDYYVDSVLPSFTAFQRQGAYVITDDQEDIAVIEAVQRELVQHPSNTTRDHISVIYLTESGKRIVRVYGVNNRETARTMLSLTETKAYRETMADLILGTDNSHLIEKAKLLDIPQYSIIPGIGGDIDGLKARFAGSAWFMPFYGDELDEAELMMDTRELREALIKDMQAMTYLQRYRPQEQELGILEFMPHDAEEEWDTTFNYGPYYYRVYPSMKNTVAVLQQAGVLTGKETLFPLQPQGYSAIKISDYVTMREWNITGVKEPLLFGGYIRSAVEVNETEWGAVFDEDGNVVSPAELFRQTFTGEAVTDPEQTQQLMQLAHPFALAEDDDYLIAFHLTDEKGEPYYQFMLVYAEDAPSFLS